MKRTIGATAMVLALAFIAAGCTRLPVEAKISRVATFAADGVTTATLTTTASLTVNYLTILQDKSLSLDRPGWGKLDYSTNNDPMQNAIEALAGLAQKGAAMAAK